MIRSFQLRLQPTKAQIAAFEDILADNCETYNAALQERRDAWRMQRKSVSYNEQCSELTQLRQDSRFTKIACRIQRDPLRRVDRAFQAFYRRCKAGQKPGYPRFKSRDRYSSFAWNEPKVYADYITVPRMGHVKYKCHRETEGTPKQVAIKREGKNWIASVMCDIGPAPEKIAIKTAVGIDLGLATFATLSDGTEVVNPRFIRLHEERTTRAHQNLSRKKRGSKNRLRAKESLRRACQRTANARHNFTHHVSKALVERYDLIAHEDLKISNMAKGTFAKSINDAAWGMLLFQLSYKAEKAGRYVVAVDPRYTSQKCSNCGEIVRKKLSERIHRCPCGTVLGRDHNAAINVLALGRSAVDVTAKGSV